MNKIRLVLAYSVYPKQSREVHGWLDLAITDNELENVGRGLVIIAGWKRVGLGTDDVKKRRDKIALNKL